MKLYIIMYHDWDDMRIREIFLSKEKAEEAFKDYDQEYHEIEEYEAEDE